MNLLESRLPWIALGILLGTLAVGLGMQFSSDIVVNVPPEECECDPSVYAELEDILREVEDLNAEYKIALQVCEKKEFDRITYEISEILEVKNNSRRKKRK